MSQPSLFDERVARPPKLTQKDRILNLLKANGTVTNYELNEICFRYGARILDLRNDGYDIQSRHIKGSLWEFTL